MPSCCHRPTRFAEPATFGRMSQRSAGRLKVTTVGSTELDAWASWANAVADRLGPVASGEFLRDGASLVTDAVPATHNGAVVAEHARGLRSRTCWIVGRQCFDSTWAPSLAGLPPSDITSSSRAGTRPPTKGSKDHILERHASVAG